VYIARIRIQNYRCFADTTIEFHPGVNVIIGENNGGKTALLSALGLILDRGGRRRPVSHDFYRGIDNYYDPPVITIALTLASSEQDTLTDKALVATWLTQIESPWEAQLTYRCFLPESDAESFRQALGEDPDQKRFFEALNDYLPRYITRIYGGNPDDTLIAEGESLARFHYQFVDALRDVQSDMFTGQDPLLRKMLNSVLDADCADDEVERQSRRSKFGALAAELHSHLRGRLALDRLFTLVEHTGAGDSGSLDVDGQVAEAELMSALRLIIERDELRLPVIFNGLGYNNLVYIALLVRQMDYQSSGREGENSALFPILVVEEPEAHLHPALQYKLLKFLRQRIAKSREQSENRQVFITTHSTHVTAACTLDDLIVLSAPARLGDAPGVAYPGRVFGNDKVGQASKRYVERFLDATKSNMLFAKGVILVEGLAEQLVIPAIAEFLKMPLEKEHVAVIPVDGSAFKHFVPLFGAGFVEGRKYSLRRPVACIIDSDPGRRPIGTTEPFKECWPFDIDYDPASYEYSKVSSVAENLITQCAGVANLNVRRGKKTFEYDLAESNPRLALLLSDSCRHRDKLVAYCEKPEEEHKKLESLLSDESKAAIGAITDEEDRARARFAAYYYSCVKHAKGEHAFELATAIRDESEVAADIRRLKVPKHLEDAIRFACNSALEDDQANLEESDVSEN
jgi:Predicted ATP-dependent endonuclease of the OLD family